MFKHCMRIRTAYLFTGIIDPLPLARGLRRLASRTPSMPVDALLTIRPFISITCRGDGLRRDGQDSPRAGPGSRAQRCVLADPPRRVGASASSRGSAGGLGSIRCALRRGGGRPASPRLARRGPVVSRSESFSRHPAIVACPLAASSAAHLRGSALEMGWGVAGTAFSALAAPGWEVVECDYLTVSSAAAGGVLERG